MQAQEPSLTQLLGYLLTEDKNVKENKMDATESHSENISRYYDCISGWNSVWIQNKAFFEDAVKKVHTDHKELTQQQLRTLFDKSKCLSHKLSQLSFKIQPEIYIEDLNFINLRQQLFRK
jgi:hypothetical protein